MIKSKQTNVETLLSIFHHIQTPLNEWTFIRVWYRTKSKYICFSSSVFFFLVSVHAIVLVGDDNDDMEKMGNEAELNKLECQLF